MKVPKQCIKSCDEAEYLEKEDLTLLIIGSGLLGKIGKRKILNTCSLLDIKQSNLLISSEFLNHSLAYTYIEN